MASKSNANVKSERGDPLRDEWPRIRLITVKGDDFYQVDGRPHFKRQAFSTLEAARKQAEKWENSRVRYGTAGKFISERDATKFSQALEILAPHGAGIIDAARHYAEHLKREQVRLSGKSMREALAAWQADYDGKDRRPLTAREIKSKAKIFSDAFGALRLSEMTPALMKEWLERYESAPGIIASPQTRANLRIKLSQLFGFAKLQGWIENNPVEMVKLERPPKAPVAVLDVKQAERLMKLADASPDRDILLPYLAVCLFAGLRPTEAERLTWRDIDFSTGEITVRGETSKVKEERYVPMEDNLIAWLESCPIRHPGPIIGPSHGRFREAWEEVKRVAGYKVGTVPAQGWAANALDWPSDVLRHTYGSMWLAVNKSRSDLAERMGNSESVIKSHYRRAIREDVARQFWEIRPKIKLPLKIVRMETA